MENNEYFKSPFNDKPLNAWLITCSIIIFFSILALYYSLKKKSIIGIDSTDFFFTARESQPLWKITWSLLSSCLGAWVLYLPPSTVISFGIVGVIAYSISAGLPIVLLALNGNYLRNKFKEVGSFSEFIFLRYGKIPQIIISFLMIFNMAAFLTSEYTMIATFFNEVLYLSEYFIIIIGSATMIYTAFGGLIVSILTDQIQGIFTICLIIVFIIFTYLNTNFNNIESYSKIGEEKYDSLFYFPLSTFSSTIFSEAIWQRVWASSNSKTLINASVISSILIALVILLSGFGGVLAYCLNKKDIHNRERTLLFELVFPLLGESSNIMGIVIAFLAITMNISAIDSLQNGFVSTLHSLMLKNKPLLLSRFAVLIINIPSMWIGTFKFGLFDIFTVSNLATTAFLFPSLIGLFDFSNELVSGMGAMVGGFGSIISLFCYGIYSYQVYDLSFIEHFYNSVSFGIALGSSIIFLGLWILVEKFFFKVMSYHLSLYGFKTCQDYVLSKPLMKEETSEAIPTI